ncbi:hypothetical protein PVA45_05905 [Entomospira entomophila]|uniref:RHS repeat-associated core domain-containing protein n=1 Tax=Entomospira entomophila TaxID=2719988 RepID=A0A968GAG8_9SPIO|nr:hypothetical protein [Entomospira entomophilus]NIZ41031.1 hypothetical protein [Entomospira entomophilus]WDI35244.1 hypothetical protein PVA45_05905 [Entomospira entomophilus]
MSSDPAMGEYLSTSEDAPAGGVFNSRNLQTYHYAGNNPIKYVDPTGMSTQESGSGSGYWVPPRDFHSRWRQIAIVTMLVSSDLVIGTPMTLNLYASAVNGHLPHPSSGRIIDNLWDQQYGLGIKKALSNPGTSLNDKIITEVRGGSTEGKDGHTFNRSDSSANALDLWGSLGSVKYQYFTEVDPETGYTYISVIVEDQFDFNPSDRGLVGEGVTSLGRNANIVDNSQEGPRILIIYTIVLDENGDVVKPEA